MAATIERLDVTSYGCIRELSMGLTPLHALVGPNDSGKSTILHALRSVVQFAIGSFEFGSNPTVPTRPFDPAMPAGPAANGTALGIHLGNGHAYDLAADTEGNWSEHLSGGGTDESAERRGWNNRGLLWRSKNPAGAAVRTILRGPARFVHFQPAHLREASPLLLDGQPIDFLDENGYGLPAFYDALLGRKNQVLVPIQADLRRLFPTADHITFRNVPAGDPGQGVWKAIEVTLRNGTAVPARRMSEGMLYFLAFAALQHAEPTSLLLVEEPETGLHPARIRDFVGMLREIAKGTQVVMATHSPLVLNELRADEISIVWRTDREGTQAVRLADTFEYAQRSKVLSNGEMWLAYADGAEERELREKPRPSP